MDNMNPVVANHIAIDRNKVEEHFDRILATSQRSRAEQVSIVSQSVFGDEHLRDIARLHMLGKSVLLTSNLDAVAKDAVWLIAPIL